MTGLLTFLRDGAFVTRARIMAWSALLVAGFAAAILFLFVTAQGPNDAMGRPLGTDFSNVYAAGTAALRGDAAAPFDILRQQKEEQALFGAQTPVYGWHYPPMFLLVAAPLAKLPYVPALLAWQGLSLLAYLGSLWLLLRASAAPWLAREKAWPLAALGFTAVFVNLTHGHNGLLTASLFAAGLSLLDRRPWIAGLLFGLVCYKPQFAVLAPLVFLATGRWRALAATLATMLVLAAATSWIFGIEVWRAFLDSTPFTRSVVLEQGSTGFHKIQSVFAWTRLWGGPVPLAYGLQGLAVIAVLLCLLRTWRSNIATGYKGAALCLSALLVTPYSLDYDMLLLAPAILLMAAEGVRNGFAPFEKTLLASLWLMPFAVRSIAQHTLVPVGVIAMMLVLAAIISRNRGANAGHGKQDAKIYDDAGQKRQVSSHGDTGRAQMPSLRLSRF